MRCNKCKDVPLTHGAERVKCEKCGRSCVVNYSYLRICDDCSVEHNVCQYCGKELISKKNDCIEKQMYDKLKIYE